MHPGSYIASYRIDSLLGVGGMGEVYRARDTKLNRDVAIKLLPAAVASDFDRLARFTREAQVLASLNHPNIGAIHGFEDQDGVHALVLELVEGPTLGDRIARGALPVEEALAIARQICDALEAAHEQGIIHRDLKPANIKVRDDGTVKVLDFGLAKIATGSSSESSVPSVTQSPIITTPAMTAVGMILGTAAYMSPEQAKGRPADKRSDIWAFGCVLYEMLTGARPFQGEDVAETLAEVIKGAPDWRRLAPDTPASVERLLRGCLEKDRKRRVGDASTIRFALDAPPSTVVTTAPPTRRATVSLVIGSVVAAALLLAAAAIWSRSGVVAPASPQVVKFGVSAPDGFRISRGQIVAISPDGANIVFGSTQQLFFRAVGDLQARPIPGTGGNADSPMFSPDGRWLAFYTAFDRKIKRVALSGGAVTTICGDVPDMLFGATWASDDFIYFGQPQQAGIFRVPAAGGTPTRVVEVKAGEYAYGPQLLPDGDGLMFTLTTGRALNYYDRAQVVVQSLKSRARTVVLSGGSDARLLPTGHLLYTLGYNVLAVPFDPATLRVGTSPVVVVENVRRGYGVAPSATTQFSVSNTGALVYLPGNEQQDRRLVMIDRAGKETPLNLPPGPYVHPRFSPNGRQLALYMTDDKGTDVGVYDLEGQAPLRMLTFDGINTRAVWMPDGERLIFTADRDGDNALYARRADGSGEMTLMVKGELSDGLQAEVWSRDGQMLVVSSSRSGQRQLMMVRPGIDSKLTPIAPVWSSNAALAPDGKWIAYMAAESGTAQDVWVRPFPPAGETKFQLTSGGAADPVWSPDGKEIFYVVDRDTPTSRIVSTPVRTEPTFSVVGQPTPLPIIGLVGSGPRIYDVSPDGRSFAVLMSNDAGTEKAYQLNVTLNWFEELKQRVPATIAGSR